MTIWSEVVTVVLPAYLPFIGPLVFVTHYKSNFVQLAKYYVIMDVIINFQYFSLSFVEWLFCLTEAQIVRTTRMVAGLRAQQEWRSAFYLYMWSFWFVTITMTVAMRAYFSLLWLWTVPALALLYCIFLQSFEYCFAGAAACPPHTGPAIHCTQILTTATFLAGFVVWRGCFLFPCLCAPEVPGYLFFPPTSQPVAPPGVQWMKEVVDADGFLLLLDRAKRGFPPPEDCEWRFDPAHAGYNPDGTPRPYARHSIPGVSVYRSSGAGTRKPGSLPAQPQLQALAADSALSL